MSLILKFVVKPVAVLELFKVLGDETGESFLRQLHRQWNSLARRLTHFRKTCTSVEQPGNTENSMNVVSNEKLLSEHLTIR